MLTDFFHTDTICCSHKSKDFNIEVVWPQLGNCGVDCCWLVCRVVGRNYVLYWAVVRRGVLAKNEAIGPPVSSLPTIFLSEGALAWPSLLNIQMKSIFWGGRRSYLHCSTAFDYRYCWWHMCMCQQITSNNLTQSRSWSY